MGTPSEDYETAADSSNDREERERGIDELETANECDLLADLLLDEDLETPFREQALDRLATMQCKPTLETIVEERPLPEDLQAQAEHLLAEVPDDPMP